MERDVLEAVYRIGALGTLWDDNLRSEVPTAASLSLEAKYKSDEDQERLKVVVNYLLEERLLYPYTWRRRSSGERGEHRDTRARGITPKGISRLKKLRAPRKTWAKKNVFPLLIAAITALVGLLGPVITAKCG